MIVRRRLHIGPLLEVVRGDPLSTGLIGAGGLRVEERVRTLEGATNLPAVLSSLVDGVLQLDVGEPSEYLPTVDRGRNLLILASLAGTLNHADALAITVRLDEAFVDGLPLLHRRVSRRLGSDRRVVVQVVVSHGLTSWGQRQHVLMSSMVVSDGIGSA